MSQRPNFYLLLELEPSIDEWHVIEARIEEKRRAWSRDRSMGNPRALRRAEANLARLAEIRAVLGDAETRRAEAKEARKQLEQERKERLRELEESIALLIRAGGSCSEEQLKKLSHRFSGMVSQEEIKRHLRSAGVKLETATRSPGQRRGVKEQIDKVTAGNIRQNLEHLGLGTLYDFLGLRPQSSPKALCDRADEIYRESQRIGKTDADASARNALAGIAKTVFKMDKEKEKYDNYLATAAMESLKPNIELAGEDGFLTREEIDALLHQARQRGVPAEDARTFIEDHAVMRKWGLQRDRTELPAEILQVCGFCSTLSAAAASRCTGCGEPLAMECPACGVENPTAHAACEGCGCRIGDAPLVKSLMREAERVALGGDLRMALRCLDKALLYWPGWKPAEDARARLAEQQKARDRELDQVAKLVQARRLCAARVAVERLRRQEGVAIPAEQEERIRRGINRAETAFEAGERCRRTGKTEQALDHFEEAVNVCADLEPALKAMAASPPPPPQALRVTPLAAGFRLAWQPPGTARRVSYRVLRKTSGSPANSGDGVIVAEVGGTSLDDPAARVGEPCYYGVFTLRTGVPSSSAALSGPHLRTADVRGLETTAGDGEVMLRWTSPPGCIRVEVWRQLGEAPKRRGEGEAVATAGSSARDVGLTNGKRYGYRICACFVDPSASGGELATPGRTAVVVPAAPPPPVQDLKATRTGRDVQLVWSPVSGASVEIRQAAKRPDLKPGLAVPLSCADRFGSLLPISSPGSAHVTLSAQGSAFFTPLSVIAETAVVGRPVEVTTLDPVTGLRAHRSAGSIALTWRWPSGSEEALVTWAHDNFPQDPHRRTGKGAEVSRREYEQDGCWLLRVAEARPYYFAVFTKASGRDLFARAAQVAESGGHEATVSYRVETRKALLSRNIVEARLRLLSSNGDLTLPPLLLVAKVPNVPVTPRDGEILAELPSIALLGGKAEIDIPKKAWRRGPYLKLFFQDPESAQHIRLLPAERDRLRVV